LEAAAVHAKRRGMARCAIPRRAARGWGSGVAGGGAGGRRATLGGPFGAVLAALLGTGRRPERGIGGVVRGVLRRRGSGAVGALPAVRGTTVMGTGGAVRGV